MDHKASFNTSLVFFWRYHLQYRDGIKGNKKEQQHSINANAVRRKMAVKKKVRNRKQPTEKETQHSLYIQKERAVKKLTGIIEITAK